MTIPLTLENQNATALTLESRASGLTWDEDTNTWDEQEGTWDNPLPPVTLETKNTVSLSLENR